MEACYYSNLYKIEDIFRKKKYENLLLLSLKNDLSKWTENVESEKVIYKIKYSNSTFFIEIRKYVTFAYILHSTNPPIKDVNNELITDSFSSDLKEELNNLRNIIFTDDIYEIEKLIVDVKNTRKEKLKSIDLEQAKQLIEETYNDWIENKSEIVAKIISKLIYSYRKNQEVYDLWLKKFDDEKMVLNFL